MPLCAYCKLERPVTKEHVIPSFMYAFQKETSKAVIGWNEVVKKMVGGEAKVKDVCATCNNAVLGELDGYAKTLLSNSGLLVRNYVKLNVTLRYAYAPLLRWLLKVSFNSSRTDGAHSYLFEEHIPFILGNAPTPLRGRVATLAYLAAPEYLGKSRIASEPFRLIAQGSDILNPFFVRICYGGIPGEHTYTLRVNIFGPVVFYMLMFNVGTQPGHAASAIRRFVKLNPGTKELTSKSSLIELQAGQQTWLDLYAPQVERTRAISGAA